MMLTLFPYHFIPFFELFEFKIADGIRRATNESAVLPGNFNRHTRSELESEIMDTQAKSASISAYGPARATIAGSPLSPEELHDTDAYWHACCYLILGMLYLRENPLLREPLKPEHIKLRLLGHWGTSPGLSLIYVHLNRAIRARDLNAIFLAGPGHGGPAVLANVYLEGTYSEIYPAITDGAAGLRVFFRQFSTPGGVPSHVSPPTPG